MRVYLPLISHILSTRFGQFRRLSCFNRAIFSENFMFYVSLFIESNNWMAQYGMSIEYLWEIEQNIIFNKDIKKIDIKLDRIDLQQYYFQYYFIFIHFDIFTECFMKPVIKFKLNESMLIRRWKLFKIKEMFINNSSLFKQSYIIRLSQLYLFTAY